MFHEHSDDYVDKNKLRHQDKDNEVDGCYDWTDTTVTNTVIGWITIFSQRVL